MTEEEIKKLLFESGGKMGPNMEALIKQHLDENGKDVDAVIDLDDGSVPYEYAEKAIGFAQVPFFGVFKGTVKDFLLMIVNADDEEREKWNNSKDWRIDAALKAETFFSWMRSHCHDPITALKAAALEAAFEYTIGKIGPPEKGDG